MKFPTRLLALLLAFALALGLALPAFAEEDAQPEPPSEPSNFVKALASFAVLFFFFSVFTFPISLIWIIPIVLVVFMQQWITGVFN